MKTAVIFLIMLAQMRLDASAKIYTRCELARELLSKHGASRDELATWVCIAQHESSYDTRAVGRLNGDGSADHGLFQISDLYWCAVGTSPGKACSISCSALEDSDIRDDWACVRKIYDEHARLSGDGFAAWAVYVAHCKGTKSKKYLEGCFDKPITANSFSDITKYHYDVDEYANDTAKFYTTQGLYDNTNNYLNTATLDLSNNIFLSSYIHKQSSSHGSSSKTAVRTTATPNHNRQSIRNYHSRHNGNFYTVPYQRPSTPRPAYSSITRFNVPITMHTLSSFEQAQQKHTASKAFKTTYDHNTRINLSSLQTTTTRYNFPNFQNSFKRILTTKSTFDSSIYGTTTSRPSVTKPTTNIFPGISFNTRPTQAYFPARILSFTNNRNSAKPSTRENYNIQPTQSAFVHKRTFPSTSHTTKPSTGRLQPTVSSYAWNKYSEQDKHVPNTNPGAMIHNYANPARSTSTQQTTRSSFKRFSGALTFPTVHPSRAGYTLLPLKSARKSVTYGLTIPTTIKSTFLPFLHTKSPYNNRVHISTDAYSTAQSVNGLVKAEAPRNISTNRQHGNRKTQIDFDIPTKMLENRKPTLARMINRESAAHNGDKNFNLNLDVKHKSAKILNHEFFKFNF